MTASYLFNSDGLVNLARYVVPGTLFVFDLDGILTASIDDTVAEQTEQIRRTMNRLVAVAKTVVITGKSRKDALGILGFEPYLLVGNHGAEWPADENSHNWNQVRLCLKWQERLYEKLCFIQGVEIEFKGESLSIYYRKAHNPELAMIQINTAIVELDPVPHKVDGKFVVNLLPSETLSKGKVLVTVMKMLGSNRTVFFGDNESDKEVFLLKNFDVFGIYVGQDGQTPAPYYLKKRSAFLGLLNSIVGILEVSQDVKG